MDDVTPKTVDETNEKGPQTPLDLSDDESPSTEEQGATEPIEDVDGEVVESTMLTPAEASSIVATDSLAVLATEDQINAAVSRMLTRIDATKRMKAALLSMTNTRDWYGMEAEGEEFGHPYLAESGAEKVMHAFKIEAEHDGGQRFEVPDGGYEYVYAGKMRALAFSDIWYPIVGSRWSDDGFFTKGGTRRADPGDVRKAALTNWYNRGIKTTCGIKTLTWDEIENVPHLAGLRSKVQMIGYKKRGSDQQAGEVSQIEKGPHIKVKLDQYDLDSRNAIKNIPPAERTWVKPGFYWAIKYTKKHLGRVADLKAANDSVKFKLENVPEEDLP